MTILSKVYFVRHGETDANRRKVIQGHLDTPLNDVGLDQAMSVASTLHEVTFDLALSSDLKRAVATATVILEYHPGLVLCQDERLRERFMGELQGLVYSSSKLLVRGSTMETRHAFSTRAMVWWKDAVVDHITSISPREKPYNILVVSHGGFIGTLIRSLIQSGQLTSSSGEILPSLPNVSVSEIEWDGEVWRLVRYGDVSHILSTGPLDHNPDEIRT